MDELLRHCLRELSFDGDLGSNVSRLRDFIVDFYAHNHITHVQNPDDAFCAFVWSLVVQHPTIQVGLAPLGITSEVWVAPQTSARRKARERGEEHVELRPPTLDPIPEPKTTPLDTLLHIYGDRLRLAVEPDSIFAAITGSHIRAPKMSPMVYSALQIITRGRYAGVTVVELGKQSGYDQKTCFYLVRQLTDLDLIVKVRRGGVGTHFCIHKYFFERSSSWKEIREEENQAGILHDKAGEDDADSGDDDDEVEDLCSLNFTPIDARHLSSLPLISGRVVRLLRASKNNIHASTNMLITLGFSNPTKTDRRFFQSRIREMIQLGLIEKVIVPSNKKKSHSKSVKCFRLVKQTTVPAENGVVLSDPDEDIDDLDPESQNGVKLGATIYNQIVELLEESGTTGMTLNELSTSLCRFDKRTIELLLTRADKFHPPPNLNDLRIASLMETSGRERRHRYFTVANYCKLVAQEDLDQNVAGYGDVDLRNVGGFTPVDERLFYEKEEESNQYADCFKNGDKPRVVRGKKPRKNPILPDGSVKKGRPTKQKVEDADAENHNKSRKKRKADAVVTLEEASLESPNKKVRTGILVNESHDLNTVSPTVNTGNPHASVKRKRGRPRKNPLPTEVVSPFAGLSVKPVIDAEESHVQQVEFQSDENWNGNPIEETQLQEVFAETDIARLRPAVHADEIQDSQKALHEINSTEPIHEGTIGLRASNIVSESPDCTIGEKSSSSVNTYANAENPVEARSEGPNIDSSRFSVPPPSTSANRINVSQLRRENELLKLVENAGGIVNIQSKEFYRTHMKLIEELAQAGEPTSAPVGTKTDKRTVTATYNKLESRGKVKQLRTAVTTLTGLNRPACIIYLPEVEQSQLNVFLADLARVTPPVASHLSSFLKIESKVDYGADSPSTSRGIPPLQLLQMERPGSNEKERWSKNLDRAQQLFNHDDAIVRDVFLAERTTMAQVYGYIVGKALRCRELHLLTMTAILEQIDSPYIVSLEKRIIDISFFFNDISIKAYCSLISPLAFEEELALFMSEGSETLVRNLPQSLQNSLQLGRSRSRSRFLDMLDVLRSLRVAIPLQPSTSENPFITCQQNGEYPASFDTASLTGWSTNTPMIAPIYWHIHESAPIYIFAQSETDPPYWRTRDISNLPAIRTYWAELREACLNSQLIGALESTVDPQTTCCASVVATRSLRRAVSWKSDYFLTWHQTQYLKQFIDTSTMATPLEICEDTERQTKLERICWVTSAPLQVVVSYFSSAREKIVKTTEKLKEKAKKTQKRAAEAKLLLAKKAEEARLQREQDWMLLLANIHPGDLESSAALRIKRIQNQFVQTGSLKDTSKWEKEIRLALQEADKHLKITTKRPPPTRQPIPPPPPTHRSSEASVTNLIEQQGPPTETKPPVKRKRKKDKDNVEQDSNAVKRPIRRHRFHWNLDFDELARDASVIIRARCRHLHRLDWAAFEQVFPTVPRNTVRQRLAHIKETPGNEAYLRRLEDTWYDIWMKYRGTPLLPDEDFNSASNFDLIKHIEFLRTHVDKNAIRVGFAPAKETPIIALPSRLEELQATFYVAQPEQTAPEWDFMWNTLIEEGREKKLKKSVLSRSPEDFPPKQSSETDEILLAESIVKLVMGSPPEAYDPEQASWLLKSRGSEMIDTATKNLLSRGVLSKLQRDPQKPKPGRQLKISEVNQNSIGGNIPQDTFQDAISLLEEIDANDISWHEWPSTATDGDCVTLIELVSDNKVDFDVDTSLPRAARPALDWNSKKADDDQIETAISVRYRLTPENDIFTGEIPASDPITEEMMELEANVEFVHGFNAENNPACCRKMTRQGCVDCKACLDDAFTKFCISLDPDSQDAAERILDVVRDAQEIGIKKSELAASTGLEGARMSVIVNLMVEARVPQVYWIGYNSLSLISAQFISRCTLSVSKDPIRNIFPRRWLDIRGARVGDFWRAALRAVMGLIIFRPGITQAEIRWRLKAVYDRQEIGEILRYLLAEGNLRVQVGFSSIWTIDGVHMPFDEEEERKVFWFVNTDSDKEWYQM